MLVWINGAFGVGKTTTADRLVGRVDGARPWDPEYVGYMLRTQLADHPVEDFQDWPSWRRLVVQTAAAVYDQTQQTLVAPQTVLRADYMREIRDGLAACDLRMFHVVLNVSADELLRRISGSAEAQPWRRDHVQRYLDARDWMAAAADLVIATDGMTPDEVAGQISTAVRDLR